MNAQGILEELGRHGAKVTRPIPLPCEEQIAKAEEALNFKFPPSYRLYQLKYSNIAAGRFDPLVLTVHGEANLVEAAPDLVAEFALPENLVPFMVDEADFLCFDLSSEGPEHRVVLWSEDTKGITETWESFADWVYESWIPALES